MKATGIVRRIDDLGRVVIPKEIRRTLRIKEGDPLEIFTDREGEVIFKKYSPIGELNSFAVQYASSTYGMTVSGYSEYVSLAAQSNISQELLMHYVYRHASLSVTDEQIEERYQQRLDSFVESAGDSETYNREYFVSYYGETTLYKQARRALIYEAVADYLLANNTVKTEK